MRQIKRIFVHCTVSYQAAATEQSLLTEFKSKGWKSPGCHYVVKTDGNIIRMWPEDKVANGVKGYNSTALHAAWIGGIDRQHPNGIDNRTDAQRVALYDLLAMLKKRYPQAEILGHRDISPDLNHNGIVDPWERIKACPCFDAKVEYKELNEL